MTGYKTYVAIILTGCAVLAQYFGLIDDNVMALIVSVLSGFGLWANSKRVNISQVETLQKK